MSSLDAQLDWGAGFEGESRVYDGAGRLRLQHFGRLRDLAIGAHVAALVGEAAPIAATAQTTAANRGCDDNGCPLPG